MAAVAHATRAHRISPALKSALEAGLLSRAQSGIFQHEPPAAQFFDYGIFRRKADELRSAFPDGRSHGVPALSEGGVLHTFAVKANPFASTLGEAKRLGLGAECASIVEVWQALRQGIPASDVIYDSPAKTLAEIKHALSLGIYVNLDNLSELEKARTALGYMNDDQKKKARIGLRINPQMGGGSIAATSTATKTSKFGFAVEGSDIVKLYKDNDFLNAIHVHTGSQGCPLDLSAQGIAAVLEIAETVNKELGSNQIQHFDIGGGVPADYDHDGDLRTGRNYTFSEYRAEIDKACGTALWSQGFKIYTEMGRSLCSKMGWTASRVEAVKVSGGRHIAICHVGADLFVRTAYQPENWPHRVSVFTPEGEPKDVSSDSELVVQDVAGPLCFSGDMLATARRLPLIEEDDIIVVHDTGAYTYSMHSRYNSRLAPAVYAYWSDSGRAGRGRLATGSSDTIFDFVKVKSAETPGDVLKFWEAPDDDGRSANYQKSTDFPNILR